MDPEDEGKSKRQRIVKWVVVGLVIAGIVAGTTLLIRRSQPGGAGEPVTTLETVNTELQAIVTKVATLETKAATQAESIANLGQVTDWDSTISEIQADIDNLQAITVPDYSTEITNIKTRLDALELAMAEWPTFTGGYPIVTLVQDNYIDITITEAGGYPIILSLLGDGLELADVESRHSWATVAGTWAYNSTLFAVIEPVDSWDVDDIIELKVVTTGEVAYATVAIGTVGTETIPEW